MERRVSDPAPPENVRLILPGGTEHPVEVAYVGFDDQRGLHVWEVTENLRGWLVPGTELVVRVDLIPPHTTVMFTAEEWGD